MSSRRTVKQTRRAGMTEHRRAGGVVGVLDVLSTGHGHMKVTITPGDTAEIEKARRMIEDMLQRGFSIFVETDDGETRRVKKFDSKRMIYYIDPPDTIEAPEPAAAAAPPPAKRAKAPKYAERPVASSRATAVGRSAGG